MRWISALGLGAILGFVLPITLNFGSGVWTDTWVGWGTIRPIAGSPGSLFSIPVFLGSAILLRLGFNWHAR